MSTHALLSPSGGEKWMTCPGSIAMEKDEPNIGSAYSDEGTAAHGLGAMCLSLDTHPSGYIGRVLTVVNGVYQPDGIEGLGELKNAVIRDFPVDIEMAGAINSYVQNIRNILLAGGEMFVEERVPIGHITGEGGAEGTADIVIVDDDELQVHDLKYGMGVKVFAERNKQGMMYLLGALRKFEPIYGSFKKFRFVIHQPRLDHVDEWSCGFDELMAFAYMAEDGAKAAMLALEFRDTWMGKDNSYLTAGEHCKNHFCRARAKCPALARFVEKAMEADFDVITPPGMKPNAVACDAVLQLIPTDLKELGRKFAMIDLVADWVKQVRAKAEAVLFEQGNSVEAQNALGIKLVEGKKGNRDWGDVEKAIAEMEKMRLKVAEIYDLSLKSPTAIEKELLKEKKKPKWWARLQPLIIQAPGKPSVAPLTDKRPPLALSTENDFQVLDGSDLV